MAKDRVGDASTKSHRVKKNSAKEKAKVVHDGSQPRNPKAFGVYSGVKAARAQKRALDRGQRKDHVPIVGKTTLIQSLVKNCTKYNLPHTKGPITIVSGKKRRITFFECPNDVADLVLLLVDASFGFEMETFEFLNILQVHGFPKIMGVLTHLDTFKDNKKLRTIKKRLKQRFWQEICGGAKVFYLSGIRYGRYPKMEIHNLNRFLSVMKFRPLTWRTKHPYVIVDRVEDMTDPQKVHDDDKCDRDVTMYGWVRGTYLKPQAKVHVAGLGDFYVRSVTHLPDPCPLPGSIKKRRLDERDKLIYAPMGDIGDLLFDKDAMYVNIPENKGRFTQTGDSDNDSDEEEDGKQGIRMVRALQATKRTLDDGFQESAGVSLFAGGPMVQTTDQPADTRVRRPAPQAGVAEEDESEEELSEDEEDQEDEDGPDIDDELGNEVWQLEGAEKEAEDEEDEEEEIEEDEDGDESGQDNEDAEDEGDDIEAELDPELRWKQNLAEQAASRFAMRAGGVRDLSSLVYAETLPTNASLEEPSAPDADWGDFRLTRVIKPEFDVNNMADSAKAGRSQMSIGIAFTEIKKTDWQNEQVKSALLAKFVPQGGEDEANGEGPAPDFEDLEAAGGQAAQELDEDAADAAIAGLAKQLEAEKSGQKVSEDYLQKKLATRAAFDAERQGDKDEDDDEEEIQRVEVEKWDANEELTGEASVAFSGLYPGLYARLEFSDVPCEFTENYDPTMPLLVGGLQPMEEQIGLLQARVKKHRWHKKILKSNDPLVVSLGWRRFQTIPQYCVQDQNDRNRFVKYTPEHSHCLCTFYGPQVPPNTGFVGIQTMTAKKASFRISATGYTMQINQSFEVVKKLKLTGVPYKIFKKTAFCKDMFNSQLEVSKFIGAKLRTVSGIRGQIKRPLKDDGNFRATFEDKILMSDIVFLRAWVPIQCQRFYNPLTTHCIPADQQDRILLMRCANHVRAAKGLSVPSQDDSNYVPIERPQRVFSKLKIPKNLQKELPFASKPKLDKKKRQSDADKMKALLTGRIQVLEPIDRKRVTLLQRLTTVKNEKEHIRKVSNQKRRAQKLKEQAKKDEVAKQKMRATKKREYAQKGEEAARAAKRARVEDD